MNLLVLSIVLVFCKGVIPIALYSLAATGFTQTAMAASMDSDQKKKMEAKLPGLRKLAKESAIVQAVLEANKGRGAAVLEMTQEKWEKLSMVDPFMKELLKNDASRALKDALAADDTITEAFVSCKDGTKVALISKPSNWSHKGKSKHEQPMQGKDWFGNLEIDNSTGLQQFQLSVPIINDSASVGSLVVGFKSTKN